MCARLRLGARAWLAVARRRGGALVERGMRRVHGCGGSGLLSESLQEAEWEAALLDADRSGVLGNGDGGRVNFPNFDSWCLMFEVCEEGRFWLLYSSPELLIPCRLLWLEHSLPKMA